VGIHLAREAIITLQVRAEGHGDPEFERNCLDDLRADNKALREQLAKTKEKLRKMKDANAYLCLPAPSEFRGGRAEKFAGGRDAPRGDYVPCGNRGPFFCGS